MTNEEVIALVERLNARRKGALGAVLDLINPDGPDAAAALAAAQLYSKMLEADHVPKAKLEKAEADADRNWQEFLDERQARMEANARESVMQSAIADRDRRIAELEAFAEMVAGLPGSCSRQICSHARKLVRGD